MTLSITAFSVMDNCDTRHERHSSIITISIKTLCIMTLSIMTISIITHSIITLSTITLSVMTLSIMTLGISIKCHYATVTFSYLYVKCC